MCLCILGSFIYVLDQLQLLIKKLKFHTDQLGSPDKHLLDATEYKSKKECKKALKKARQV